MCGDPHPYGACSVPSFCGLFFVLFPYFGLSVPSCVLFAGESLLPCAPRVGAME